MMKSITCSSMKSSANLSNLLVWRCSRDVSAAVSADSFASLRRRMSSSSFWICIESISFLRSDCAS